MVMVPLRRPEGKRGQPATARRNSRGQDEHCSKGDVTHVPRTLPSCLLRPSPGVITGASSRGKESPNAWSEVWVPTAAEQTWSTSPPEVRALQSVGLSLHVLAARAELTRGAAAPFRLGRVRG